jgi:hypothetical protein
MIACKRVCTFAIEGGKLVCNQAVQAEASVENATEEELVSFPLCPAAEVVAVVRRLNRQSLGHYVRTQALLSGKSGIAKDQHLAKFSCCRERLLKDGWIAGCIHDKRWA